MLQKPIWSTAIHFLNPTVTSPILESSNLLAIGTAYKQLQIYDVRVDSTQRRPILHTPEFDTGKKNILHHRVTCLTQLNANEIVVGDSAGYIYTLDMRKLANNGGGRIIEVNAGRYNGLAGSVRQIIKHETLPIIACVGLDRMLRTFDMNKKKQLDCVYLKQQLSCMLFCDDETWNNGSIHRGEGENDKKNEKDGRNLNNMGSKDCIEDLDKLKDYMDCSDEEET